MVVDDEIFFYCNKVIINSEHPDGMLENSLYQINIKDTPQL